MNTIEQAREVSAGIHLHVAANGDTVLLEKAVDTIDSLIAELVFMKAMLDSAEVQVDDLIKQSTGQEAELEIANALVKARLSNSAAGAQPAQQESVDVIATMNVIRSNLESYAAPVQAQPVQQEPLSDDEITIIECQVDDTWHSDDTPDEWTQCFARAIEQAHGIKEQK